MKKLLKALGLPTEQPNGHELWCVCIECRETMTKERRAIQERIKNGDPPETLLEMLVAARRRARDGKKPS